MGGCGKEWEENLGKHNRRSGIRPKKKRVRPVRRSFNYIFMQQPQKNPSDIRFSQLTYRNFFSKLLCTRSKPNKEIRNEDRTDFHLCCAGCVQQFQARGHVPGCCTDVCRKFGGKTRFCDGRWFVHCRGAVQMHPVLRKADKD